MRHRMAGKQLSRNTPHRKATRRNMAVALFQHEAIRTTQTKAKELRRFVEKLITLAKEGTLHARRRVISAIGDREMFNADGEPADNTVIQKLFDEIAPRYADRPGGYTRIIHLAERRIGDAGKQVVLQLVEQTPPPQSGKSPGQSRRKRRAEKRHKAAAAKSRTPQQQQESPLEEQQTTPQSQEESSRHQNPEDLDQPAENQQQEPQGETEPEKDDRQDENNKDQ